MKNFTEEQKLEMWILTMWGEAWRLSDEILIWLAESYSQFFEIKDNIFNLKKFKTTFIL